MENEDDVLTGDDNAVSITATEDDLFNIVNGIPANRKNKPLNKDKIRFDDIFNHLSDEIKKNTYPSKELKFLDLMNEGISQIYNERFNR